MGIFFARRSFLRLFRIAYTTNIGGINAVEQELRYAQLLEIPVESCTVITKKSKKRTANSEERLKNKAIQEVNRQAEAVETLAQTQELAIKTERQENQRKKEDLGENQAQNSQVP